MNTSVLRSKRGNAYTLFLLILLPLIVSGTIAYMEHARAVYGSDLDLQQALNSATRSAAYSVDDLSQAYYNPMLVPDTAHLVFRNELAKNLSLDENLVPTEKSGIKNPVQYVFIVFNGENDYGLDEGVKYSTSDPGGTEFTGTLPSKFTISDCDTQPGEGTGIITELDKPGCIAVVKADMKPLINGDSTGIRWVASKVVSK